VSGEGLIYTIPAGVKVLEVKYRETGYPTELAGSFRCNDEDYNVLWKKAARTLYLCIREHYMDCPDRERREWLGDAEVDSWLPTLDAVTPEILAQGLGSWIMLSDDRGATWGAPIRVPVSAPHGPILLHSGDLFYIGKSYMNGWGEMEVGAIMTARSRDGGRTWERQGAVPVYPGTDYANYHEPHVVELPSGRLIGMIRVEDHADHKLEPAGVVNFSIMQTASDDGGMTWTPARPLGFHGSPPHLIRHSSGVLVMTYGYRLAPFGQRVAFSHDDGVTWDHDWIVRDDGPDSDLGYPSSVELDDGSLLTVCYQKVPGDRKCSLLWSRWRMP